MQPHLGTGQTAVRGSGDLSSEQATGASQSSQTNPEQYVNPSAATGVQSGAQVRGDDNRIRMDSSATTNQSTSASQNTGSTQGQSVSPRQGASSSLPGMGAVPGVSGGVIGGADASAAIVNGGTLTVELAAIAEAEGEKRRLWIPEEHAYKGQPGRPQTGGDRRYSAAAPSICHGESGRSCVTLQAPRNNKRPFQRRFIT